MEDIQQDTERDYFLGSEEALDYGIIDSVLTERINMAETETV